MKKFFSVVLVLCLAVTALIFVGCTDNNIKLEVNPDINDTVSGNGSFAVRKGDYIYFASGLVKSSDLGTGGLTNEHGKVTNGALYRAKIETKTEEVAPEKPEDEPTTKTEVVLTDIRILLSKVVGFENSGLYIFGNKLYFASPSIKKSEDGKVNYDQLTFYTLDLDGQNLTEIYTTVGFSNGSYSYVLLNGNVYLLLNTGSQILKIDAKGNSTLLVEDFTSYYLPKTEYLVQNSYNAAEYEKFVYVTLKNEETTSAIDYGTVLYKVNILTGEKTEVYKENFITLNIQKIVNGKLFFTHNVLLTEDEKRPAPSTKSYLFVADLTAADVKASEQQISHQSAITDVVEFVYEDNEMDGYVYVNGGKLYFRDKDESKEPVELSSTATNVLFVQGKYVYFVRSSAVYRVDATASKPSGENLSRSTSIDSTYFDIDEQFIFFYVRNTDTSLYETYYVDLANFVDGVSSPKKLVG